MEKQNIAGALVKDTIEESQEQLANMQQELKKRNYND